jgi:hypothetical protein
MKASSLPKQPPSLPKKLRSSYVLRVLSKGNDFDYELQDLHTGQRLTFESWENLQKHLEKATNHTGLR